jgi:hypoxanthine-guanine phosphoribosyltransferase
MKKVTYTCIVILACLIFFASCKKAYHCHCTYNNMLMASYDLGNQTKDNANKQCSAHDSDVAGEVWTCTTY